MGTVVEVTVAHRSEVQARVSIKAAFGEIDRIERVLSSYLPESVISRINREGFKNPVSVPREVIEVLKAAVATSEESGGAFDVTIGPVTRLWGFETGGSVPESARLANAVKKVGYKNLIIDEARGTVGFAVHGMAIDLGAIGKRWAVDKAVAILRARGVENAIVDIGGDIRLIGARPGKDHWRIAVQHPRELGKSLMSFDLSDAAIITSGDYERFFIAGDTRYHHILDPLTGEPARGCQSVTLIAPTAMEACATAVFVLGPERGMTYLRGLPGVRGVIVDAAGRLHWSDAALERSARR